MATWARGSARLAGIALATWVSAGCTLLPLPDPSRVVWGDRVPTPAPDVVASRVAVAGDQDSVTFLPISPTGAAIGVDYAYDMPHCGIASPIDVDGSFWDAAGEPENSVEFDGQSGVFRLTSPNEATLTRSDGRVLLLVRHQGAKRFRLCA